MIFDTFWFICFFLVVILLYWISPIYRRQWRLCVLIVASVIFHFHFAGAAGVLPIILLALIVYAAGLSRIKSTLVSAIIICLIALILYKYTSFLVHSLVLPISADLSGKLDELTFQVLPATAPLAISFFTFEFIHYLYEIKQGGEPIKDPLRFALFTLFFPSLVAGPIKRYQQFQQALEKGLAIENRKIIVAGLILITTGYLKKVLLADNLAWYAEKCHSIFKYCPIWERWEFLVVLSFRIYLDFSAYSDIAVGLAMTLGIDLVRNFNWPYTALNIKEFWRRWHISLSTWIRDYIYIPLGGGKQGLLRTASNGALAFALCGLWHGAQWHYVFWGLYHGFGLAVCNTYRQMPAGIGERLYDFMNYCPLAKWFLTYLFVSVGWLFFFYPLDDAWQMIELLFTPM